MALCQVTEGSDGPSRIPPSQLRSSFTASPHLRITFGYRWRRGSAAEADRSSNEQRNDSRATVSALKVQAIEIAGK